MGPLYCLFQINPNPLLTKLFHISGSEFLKYISCLIFVRLAQLRTWKGAMQTLLRTGNGGDTDLYLRNLYDPCDHFWEKNILRESTFKSWLGKQDLVSVLVAATNHQICQDILEGTFVCWMPSFVSILTCFVCKMLGFRKWIRWHFLF